MADDIVTRLRFFLYEAPEKWDDRMKWHAWGHIADAADYIEQLQVSGDSSIVVTEDLVKKFPTTIDALREVARLQNIVNALSESLSSLAQEKAFWERQAQSD